MFKRSLFAVFLVLALAPCAPAQGPAERVFPNGLKALVTEDHKSPLVTVQIWYRVGSKDEEAAYAGISHLLEHMMFKGTEKFGPSEYSKLIQKYGGVDNAFTTKDYTMYYSTLSSDRLSLALELEADRMKGLLIDPKETLSERDVVMEERRMRYEDDPQSSLYEEVLATAFRAHSYHWPVIGWMSTIKNITPEALRRHYEAYYSPDNAVIVMAGDVNAEEAFGLVEKHFGGIKPRERKTLPSAAEPGQKGEKRVYLKKEAELPYLLGVYHVPSFPQEDAYALEVLAGVLSGGKSARLYKSLIYEKKIALSAFADFSGLSEDPFLFYIGGTPAAGHTAQELEAAINGEIEKTKKEPPTEFEIQRTKNQIESSFLMGQDSIFFQGELLGMFEMLGDWRMKDEYIPGIRKVTADEVARVANKYLLEEGRTTGILIPVKGESPDRKAAGGHGH
jgi:zinc protease